MNSIFHRSLAKCLLECHPGLRLQMNCPCADNRNIHVVIPGRGRDAVTDNRLEEDAAVESCLYRQETMASSAPPST